MKFVNEQHQQDYERLRRWQARREDDIYFDSALYVLAAVGKKQISQYIDEDGIHFPDLIEVAAPWSTSEKGMIHLAWELFNGGPSENKWGIHNIFGRLGDPWCRVALEAIQMWYHIS